MKNKFLTILWAGLFIVCAGLGFIPEPERTARFLLTFLSLLFFLPPALLLHGARKEKNKAIILLIRNLAALSLGLTLVLLILNFLTVLSSDILGQILHYVLIIVSCPMICCGNWAMSLFLWACLLVASQQKP